MKIPGYTLHGDCYLADEVIPNKTWKEACKMRKFVNLPNGKMVITHTLSKEELKTIPQEERGIDNYWYWTNTLIGGFAWYVLYSGIFHNFGSINYINNNGGVRLGFHKSEIKQFLDVE